MQSEHVSLFSCYDFKLLHPDLGTRSAHTVIIGWRYEVAVVFNSDTKPGVLLHITVNVLLHHIWMIVLLEKV